MKKEEVYNFDILVLLVVHSLKDEASSYKVWKEVERLKGCVIIVGYIISSLERLENTGYIMSYKKSNNGKEKLFYRCTDKKLEGTYTITAYGITLGPYQTNLTKDTLLEMYSVRKPTLWQRVKKYFQKYLTKLKR